MPKILLCHPGPEFSVHDVFVGWEKALKQAGHQVMTFNLNHRLMYHGNTYLKAYPEGWEGTRQLPTCPACGQEPFKKALNDDQVKIIATKQVFELAYTFWPDIIFLVSGFFYDEGTLEILRSRGHKIVMLHTESPYEDERQMKIGSHVDLNLINDPMNLELWRNEGLSTYYMPHAFNPDVHYPAALVGSGPGTVPSWGETKKEADFAFIGTGFKSRRDFFGKLDLPAMHRDGLRLTIGGGGWGDAVNEPENAHLLDFLGHHPEECVDNEETARVYRMTKVGLNMYRREGEDGKTDLTGWAMGPREIEMAACGLFFLRDPRPESDELFGDILPTFRNAEDAAELIRRWAHPSRDDERTLRALLAMDRVADRTFAANVVRFFQYMDEAGLTV